MKVQYLVCMAGLDHVIRPGEVCDVSADEGARLIEKGFAIEIVENTTTTHTTPEGVESVSTPSSAASKNSKRKKAA